jgi:hypothetical protein
MTLRKYVPPDPDVDVRRVAKLIDDLDDDDFEVRQKAERDLRALAAGAELALRAAKKNLSLEQLHRIRSCPDRVDSPVRFGLFIGCWVDSTHHRTSPTRPRLDIPRRPRKEST